MRKRRFLLLVAIIASLAGVGYKVTAEIWANKLRDIRKNPIQLLDQLPESALSIKDFRRAKVENGRTVWELLGEDNDRRPAGNVHVRRSGGDAVADRRNDRDTVRIAVKVASEKRPHPVDRVEERVSANRPGV